MPLFRTYQQGKLRVGIWKVEETVEQLQAMLVPFNLYQSQFSAFKAPRRRLEWLAVRVLLQEMCGELKAIDYLPSGKPYLRDGSMKVSFSHTQGYVAVALHPELEVGVDIEQYGERVKKVASRFLSEDERWMLDRPEEIYALLLHWSAKETLYKLVQVREADFVEHLRILPFNIQSTGSFYGCEYCTPAHARYLIYYDTHPDFVLTYSCQAN